MNSMFLSWVCTKEFTFDELCGHNFKKRWRSTEDIHASVSHEGGALIFQFTLCICMTSHIVCINLFLCAYMTVCYYAPCNVTLHSHIHGSVSHKNSTRIFQFTLQIFVKSHISVYRYLLVCLYNHICFMYYYVSWKMTSQARIHGSLLRIAECCSVLQRNAVCCSVMECVAAYWSVLQCLAVCCSVL